MDPLNSSCGSCLFVLGAFRLTPDLLFFSDLSLKILDESFFNKGLVVSGIRFLKFVLNLYIPNLICGIGRLAPKYLGHYLTSLYLGLLSYGIGFSLAYFFLMAVIILSEKDFLLIDYKFLLQMLCKSL